MMNQEDIFKKIGQILSELNDQYQYLAQNPQELNELELELFLANADFLSDHVQIIKKINSQTIQKALPEHTHNQDEDATDIPLTSSDEHDSDSFLTDKKLLFTDELVEQQPEIPVNDEHEVVHTTPKLEDEIFKPDIEPAVFEFILNEKSSSNLFEFEEKSVDEIFDRPFSKEEELIIAQKQKLREMDSLEMEPAEDDEIGPEPFLVAEPIDEKPEVSPEVEEPAPITEEPTDAVEEPLQELADTVDETPEQVNEVPEPDVKLPEMPVAQEELFRPMPQPLTKPTLNDILSGNTIARNVNTASNRLPITDLKQAISLNDKMRYIKDLFNGYNLAYAEAIDLLNKMPDFKTADTFLQNNYAVKHNWADKQETADQFYELLNQRFPIK